MFPKILASGRSKVGSLSGTVGEVLEASTGKIYLITSLTSTVNDPSDTVQGEYWDGASWVEASDSTINNLNYFAGLNVRYHIKNSYFNYSGPYITGTAGTITDTGGATTLGATFDTFSVWSAFILGTNPNAYAQIRLVNFPVATYTGVPLSSFALKADMSWTENTPVATKNTSYTFNFWPTFTGGWSSAGSPPRIVVNSVSGGLADINIEIPVTLVGTYNTTVSASVEFRAYYPNSSPLDYSSFAYRTGIL